MIKDLGLFAWRIGQVLIIGVPLLYIAGVLGALALGHRGNSVAELLMMATMVIPQILLSMAFGCALCLLVRIEKHLRTASTGNE
jgi:ABC-type spermidine/putrescine transport system permease subunit II